MRIKSLREALESVHDPKAPYHYPLSGVLTLVCLATMCGIHEVRAIARWGKNNRWELAELLGFPREKMPTFSTVQDALHRVNDEELSQIIGKWGDEILRAHGHEGLQGIAIDGKTLRGSRRDEVPAVHLLGAFAHEFHLVIGQVPVDSKTNEIGGIDPLLSQLTLEGRVVTVDALLSQHEIAATIREKKGII